MIVSSLISDNITGLEINDIGVVKDIDNNPSIYFIRLDKIIELDVLNIKKIDPSKYGDKFDEKICNICHKILPTQDFALNQTGVGNRPIRRPSCSKCRQDIDGKAMIGRKSWDDNKPFLIDFKCPICQKITIPGLTSKVVLNHDHKTGKITGWICDSCNTGLGRFKDSPEVLAQAIKYLRLEA
jgi:uncharacterized protein YlaI